MLHYRYEMSGQDIDPPYASHVDIDVREVAADGAKSVYFDMFEGADRRAVRPDRGAGAEPAGARASCSAT